MKLSKWVIWRPGESKWELIFLVGLGSIGNIADLSMKPCSMRRNRLCISSNCPQFADVSLTSFTSIACISLNSFLNWSNGSSFAMRSTPEYKAKSAQASRNQRSEVGGPSSSPFVHGGGSISIYEHSLRLEKKLGRKSTALYLCLYLHTKDYDDVTFLDPRAEAIAAVIHERTRELSQLQPDTPIDETELYLEIVQRNNKGQRFGLGWTPSGSMMRRLNEVGSSRPNAKKPPEIHVLVLSASSPSY